jgi:hypothetical protein
MPRMLRQASRLPAMFQLPFRGELETISVPLWANPDDPASIKNKEIALRERILFRLSQLPKSEETILNLSGFDWR